MKHARPARGFAMVAAIALLVLLAMLGAFMLSLSNTQQVSITRDLQGSRAYYAARAGIEWGSYQAVQSGICATGALPNAITATGFAVQVACVASGPYDEAGVSVKVYQITATASTGTLGAHDYAERQLQAVVSTP